VNNTNNHKSDVQTAVLPDGAARYNITGREMKRVLTSFGASQTDFAKYAKRTQQWISLMCNQNEDVYLKYRWAVMLEEFVGRDIYESLILEERARRKKLFETRQKAIL
jgi:hypothetical protein